MQRIATISDVAHLAGVSGRHRVEGAQQQRPGARRDPAGASWRPRSNCRSSPIRRHAASSAAHPRTVGLLTSDSVGRFGIPVMLGAEDAFGAGEMAVLLCDARGDSIREQHYIRTLLARRVDGIIVVGESTDPRPSISRDLGVPVVYAYGPLRRSGRRVLRPRRPPGLGHRHQAPGHPRPPTDRPRDRPGDLPGGQRTRRGRRRRTGRGGPGTRPGVLGPVVTALGQAGRRDGAARRPRGRRGLLWQRPDRRRFHRGRKGARRAASPRTSPSSATTTGRSWPPRAARR